MRQPRQHHYGFAHGVLAQLATTMGARMLDEPPPRGYDAALAAIWDGFGDSLPEDERLDRTGLAGRVAEREGLRMLLVTMPVPVAPAEAYYAAIVRAPGDDVCRYFTMEHTVSPIDGTEGTVLGGWADGSHLNYGSCGSATIEDFVDAIMLKTRRQD